MAAPSAGAAAGGHRRCASGATRGRSPRPIHWSEQDPDDWLRAVAEAVAALRAQVGAPLAPDALVTPAVAAW